MKKLLMMAATLFGFICVMTTAKAESGFAASDDFLWRYDGEALFCQQTSGEEAEIAQISNVWLITAREDQVYCVCGDGDEKTVRVLKRDGMFVEERSLGTWPVLTQFAVDESAYYFIAGESEENCAVYRLSFDGDGIAEKIQVANWKNTNVTCMSIVNNTLAVAQKDGQDEWLTTIRLDAGEQICSLYPFYNVQALYLRGEVGNDWYAYVLTENRYQNRLSVLNLRTGTDTELAVYGDFRTTHHQSEDRLPESCVGLWVSGNRIYTWDEKKRQPVGFSTSDWSDMNYEDQLTLVNCTQAGLASFDQAVERFNKKYPDMAVKIRTIDDWSRLDQWFIDNEPGFDVMFWMREMQCPGPVLARAGVWADVKEDMAKENGDTDYLDVFAALSTNDMWYAIPTDTMVDVWRINRELFDEVCLTPPEGTWKWSDFFALGEQLTIYNREHGSNYMLLEDEHAIHCYLLRQYVANALNWQAGEITVDEDQLTELISRWLALFSKGLLSFEGADYQEEMPADALFSMVGFVDYASLSTEPLILPPVVDEKTRYPISIVRAAANARSPHAEEARYFLTCLMDEASLKATAMEELGQMLADTVGYAEGTQFFDENGHIDSGVFWNETSEANADLWRNVVENGIMEERDELVWFALEQLMPEVYDKTLSIEQFVASFEEAMSLQMEIYNVEVDAE